MKVLAICKWLSLTTEQKIKKNTEQKNTAAGFLVTLFHLKAQSAAHNVKMNGFICEAAATLCDCFHKNSGQVSINCDRDVC